MGLWSLLAEIAKALVPHAAPHVARGVVTLAKDRIGPLAASRRVEEARVEEAKAELGRQLSDLQERLAAAEDRAATAEARALAAEAEFAAQLQQLRRWILALLAWNVVVTILVILLFFIRR